MVIWKCLICKNLFFLIIMEGNDNTNHMGVLLYLLVQCHFSSSYKDNHGSSCQLYVLIIFQQCFTTGNVLIPNLIFQWKEMTIQTHDTLSIYWEKSGNKYLKFNSIAIPITETSIHDIFLEPWVLLLRYTLFSNN